MSLDASLGCVVIGRNEAAHIGAVLASVRAAVGDAPIVYVDSASRDESTAIAARTANFVHHLDPARPLSAARARNEGFDVVTATWPGIDFVMLLDGDCLLHPDFMPAALAQLHAREDLAAVVGMQTEKVIPGNRFTYLAQVEWASKAGDVDNFGDITGNMLVRVTDFRAFGGFNARVIAGEDSEFGVRLRLAGRIITKLDIPMAEHQGCITQFREWWMRSVRAGHALAERYMLHGGPPLHDCRRDFYRTLFWGLAVPAAAILPAYWTYGFSLMLLLGYPASFTKSVLGSLSKGQGLANGLLKAQYEFYHKAANMLGLVKYFRRRLSGQIQIIEYRQPAIKKINS